jgi:hypothetical protein
MKELTLQEAALAWAQGKRVEAMGPLREEWGLIAQVGGAKGKVMWDASLFARADRVFMFRIAPEPPAKRYRPWTPEEVPVGAVTRPKVGGDILMIIGRIDGALLAGDSGPYPLSALLDAREHSTDNGKTWLPCGVEVEA